MRVLYGTTNPAKLESMKRITKSLGLEIIGLNELNQPLPVIEENGKNPLENAKIKAKAYYEAFSIPVFSCDSGLYFDELEDFLQPGTHIRRVDGKELNDDEMIEYYSNLARKYNNRLIGRYRNAVCFIVDDETCFSSMEEALSTEPFILVSEPHGKRVSGFPLDSLSIDIASGKYYYDLEDVSVDQSAIELGYREFFSKALSQMNNSELFYKGAKRYNGTINVLHLIEGAKQAEGLTVIIDVFRAFSLECYLYDMGVREIRPIGTIEEAFRLRDTIADSVLVGERNGKKCEGFDYGNSPSTIPKECVVGKTIIHTTSAGTQGIVNAAGASEIITGSLVNARAVANYILAKNPKVVSLVCMGNGGVRPAAEDELCAEYIKSILEGNELPDMEQRVAALQQNGGEHFFDRENQEVFPEEDFWMCIKYNRFPFVIQIERDEMGYVAVRRAR